MRALVLAALIAAPIFAAVPAMADPAGAGTYINLGYTHADNDGIRQGLLGGRLGYALNPNFAVEGEAGIGVVDDTVGPATVKTTGALGAFAVARAPVAQNLNLLARAGYLHSWAEAKAFGTKVEDDDGSFGIGVGAEYMFDGVNGVRGDYTRYTDNDGTDAVSVAFVRKF